MVEIQMTEPTDAAERADAIRMCRANARVGNERWADVQSLVPYRKWIWMWNHGRAEWDPNDPEYTAKPKAELPDLRSFDTQGEDGAYNAKPKGEPK